MNDEIRKAFEEKTEQLNALHAELQRKPDDLKLGYTFSAGGILNAYREGDIVFGDAIVKINELRQLEIDELQTRIVKCMKENHDLKEGLKTISQQPTYDNFAGYNCYISEGNFKAIKQILTHMEDKS